MGFNSGFKGLITDCAVYWIKYRIINLLHGIWITLNVSEYAVTYSNILFWT